jgi:multiple sugar transport system ATP-binding protein
MIYVTHDQIEAMTLGSRIAVMNEGLIQQFDEPLTVFDSPANRFVAGFIGSPPMNFLNGQIIKKDGKLYFDEGELLVKIQERMYGKLQNYADTTVVLGIRPENIYDKLFASAAPPENTVRVKCEVIEPMGSENHILLSTKENSLRAIVDAHDKPTLGDYIEMVFDMNRVHFFDNDTQQTIV